MAKLRPILFNTEMVRAILEGRKTVTRRIAKPQTVFAIENNFRVGGQPFYQGDILYVRETWATGCTFKTQGKLFYKADGDTDDVARWIPSIHMQKEVARIFLRVTNVHVERLQSGFSEPICPILELLDEGIDIGDHCRECIDNYGEPCCVETVDEDGSNLYGGECGTLDDVREKFAEIWDSTIRPADRDRYSWAANPWVWVIEFERVEKPKEDGQARKRTRRKENAEVD